MKAFKSVEMALAAVIKWLNFAACGSDDKNKVEKFFIIGTWECEGDYPDDRCSFTFKEDGTIVEMYWNINTPNDIWAVTGKYEITDNKFAIKWDDEDDWNFSGSFNIKGNTLTLYPEQYLDKGKGRTYTKSITALS